MSRNFSQINRLMGTAREMKNQTPSGEDQLESLLNSIDPYWEDREETEMDIFQFQSPITVGPDGKKAVTTTARGPGPDEEHAQNRVVLMSEMIPFQDD